MFQTADEQTFEDGQIIWEEGSFGDWIYVIESGEVELSKMVRGERVQIEVLRPEEIFGEIGYITKGSRPFTARAIGTTVLGIVDRDYLDQEYNRMANSFKTILNSLASRLRKAVENVNFGRTSSRTPKVLSLVFKSRESLINACTGNACQNGLLIKTPKPLPMGEKFSLKLQLPDNAEPLKIECEVAWSRTETNDPVRRPVGMGVKFLKISETDKQRLDGELRSADPKLRP